MQPSSASSSSSEVPPGPRRSGRSLRSAKGATRSLSREAIITAALEVLDADGLDAVTMRRVADALGTGPASLYAHVADKDEMIAAVLDRIHQEIAVPDTIDPEHWQDQLKAMIRDLRATYARHRDAARASLGNIPTGEGSLPAMNALVGILLAGGVVPQVASLSVDTLTLFATATSFEEGMETTFSRDDPVAHELFHENLKSFFGSLPADRYPYLVALAEPLTTGDEDHRFEFGLDLLVRGIASTVKP